MEIGLGLECELIYVTRWKNAGFLLGDSSSIVGETCNLQYHFVKGNKKEGIILWFWS